MSKILLVNKNEDTIYQNIRDAAESVPEEKGTDVNEFIKKERSQINTWTFYLKALEEEQTKPKARERRK